MLLLILFIKDAANGILATSADASASFIKRAEPLKSGDENTIHHRFLILFIIHLFYLHI